MSANQLHTSKINGLLQNATATLSNANSLLGAGGNTLQTASTITRTLTNFTQPNSKNNKEEEQDKPKTNWMLIGGLGLFAYLLLKPKKR